MKPPNTSTRPCGSHDRRPDAPGPSAQRLVIGGGWRCCCEPGAARPCQVQRQRWLRREIPAPWPSNQGSARVSAPAHTRPTHPQRRAIAPRPPTHLSTATDQATPQPPHIHHRRSPTASPRVFGSSSNFCLPQPRRPASTARLCSCPAPQRPLCHATPPGGQRGLRTRRRLSPPMRLLTTAPAGVPLGPCDGQAGL
jgi:hypothetical protein